MLWLPDPEKPFVLFVDWSSLGCGAVLSQQDPDKTMKIIAYASRSLKGKESVKSSYEGEMMAAVWAMDYFRHYLEMVRFKLVTDNSALQWLKTCKPTPKLMRWIEFLSAFNFDVLHWAGKNNPADLFSRIPLIEQDPTSLTEELEAKVERQCILFTWAETLEETLCEHCDSDNDPDKLLLCDYCGSASHTYCVGLSRVPKGAWYCRECSVKKETMGAKIDVTMDTALF